MNLYLTFRSFLKERGCESEFEEAFGSQVPGYCLDAQLWEILGGDEYFLGRAFEWDRTIQGRTFWAEKDSQWYKIASEYINQKNKM
jgi:hypothetical protein